MVAVWIVNFVLCAVPILHAYMFFPEIPAITCGESSNRLGEEASILGKVDLREGTGDRRARVL
jgi:hypothetical protein